MEREKSTGPFYQEHWRVTERRPRKELVSGLRMNKSNLWHVEPLSG